jgi:hypothetical protein
MLSALLWLDPYRNTYPYMSRYCYKSHLDEN